MVFMKSFRVNVNGESLLFNEGEKYSVILKKDYINEKIPITLAKQRNKYYEFTDLINNDGDVELINISDPHGKIAQSRTLQFVFIKATLDLFKDARINIEHSIRKGTFGEIHKEKDLD